MKSKSSETFLIVYAHSEEKSLCSSIKDRLSSILFKAKKHVLISDLYEMNFNPCISSKDFLHLSSKQQYVSFEQEQKKSSDIGSFDPQISQEIEKIEKADFVIFIAPMYWGSVPAILKGWFDRTLVRGKAWDMNQWFESGLFKGKKALLILTSGSKESDFQKGAFQNISLENLLHHITDNTLKFCGFDVLKPFVFYETGSKPKEIIEEDLKDFEEFINKIFEGTPSIKL